MLARPYLKKLAHETSCTALLAVFAGEQIVLVAKADAPEPLGISAPLGHRLHHSAGAFGKIFHASLEPVPLRRLLAHHPPRRFTANTIVARAAHREEIDTVRRRGYALDIEEYLEGVAAAGVPVHDSTGATVASICVVGLSARLPRQELAKLAIRARCAAAALSRDLGFSRATGWPGSDDVAKKSSPPKSSAGGREAR